MNRKKVKIVLLCAFLLALFSACQGKENARDTQTSEGIEFAMNTWVEQKWHGENAKIAYTNILTEIARIEKKLSLYIEDSEISKINTNSGIAPVVVSTETLEFLEYAKKIFEKSDNMFSITIAPLTTLWNITGENPIVPTKEEINSAMLLVDDNKLIIDREKSTAFLEDAGMEIDLGAIAKGYAVGRAMEIAKNYSIQGFCSIGGNTMVLGKKANGEGYSVGIKDPRGKNGEIIGTIDLEGLTIATTGDYERFFVKDSVRYHHVIDPTTGSPRKTDLISVSVISPDGTMADAYSTVIFMQGVKELESHFKSSTYMLIAVSNDNNIYISNGLKGKFTPGAQTQKYIFNWC